MTGERIPQYKCSRRKVSFGKELAAIMPSTFVSVICLSFSLSSQRREKPDKKKRITPDLRLEGLRKEREIFLFCFALTELDWNSVMIEEGWDKTKIQNGGRNGTLEVGQFLDKSDA